MTTPRYGHPPIAMARKDGHGHFTRAGHFSWSQRPEGRVLVLAIPCIRFGKLSYCMSEWTIDHKNHCDAQWSWDGNEKKPTLRPSLHAVGIWHGYVRNGLLAEA